MQAFSKLEKLNVINDEIEHTCHRIDDHTGEIKDKIERYYGLLFDTKTQIIMSIINDVEPKSEVTTTKTPRSIVDNYPKPGHITNWRNLREGDILRINDKTHMVNSIEDENYEGNLTVCVKPSIDDYHNDTQWINIDEYDWLVVRRPENNENKGEQNNEI